MNDIQWMARCGELLPPRPTPSNDPDLNSHLFGPSLRTVQMERIEVIELDEDGRVVWRT